MPGPWPEPDARLRDLPEAGPLVAMIENAAWLARARAFAEGLAKLKAKHEQGQGAELTAAEVDGLIWAIQQLRGASRDAAEPS